MMGRSEKVFDIRTYGDNPTLSYKQPEIDFEDYLDEAKDDLYYRGTSESDFDTKAEFDEVLEDRARELAFDDSLDSNTQCNKFIGTYNEHYDTAYPFKSKSIRRRNERKNSKPWILPWLEDACARKNKLYHDFVKNRSPQNKAKYDKRTYISKFRFL